MAVRERGSLTRWDELAPRLIEAAAPVRFDVALTPAQREAVYRLRYEAVIERGWAESSELSDGLERDAHDDVAVHVVGWRGDLLVTTSRLVFPQAGRDLPTEEAFGLRIEPEGQVADLGRMVVAREAGSRGNRIFLGLIGRSWIETRARGFTWLCGIYTSSMIRLCEGLGFRVEPLGPARRYWGEERQPVIFDGTGSRSTGPAALARRAKGLGPRPDVPDDCHDRPG